MGQRPRTLAVARDPGAAAALAPLIRSGPVSVVAVGAADAHFERLGVRCEWVDDSDARQIDAALDHARPEVVVTGTSLRVARDAAWWRATRHRGLRSVALIDHWTRFVERFTESAPFDRLPDVIAVMDDSVRSDLIALGCPTEQIAVTGQPALDDLLDGRMEDSMIARSRWGATRGERVLLFVSEPLEKDMGPSAPFSEADVLAIVLRASGGLVDRVVVRPHPREVLDTIAALVSTSPRAMLDTATPPSTAIAGADVVIGMGSIMLLEAAIAGLPVLSVQPSDDTNVSALSARFSTLIDIARTEDAVRFWLAGRPVRLGRRKRDERNERSGLRHGASNRLWALLAQHARIDLG